MRSFHKSISATVAIAFGLVGLSVPLAAPASAADINIGVEITSRSITIARSLGYAGAATLDSIAVDTGKRLDSVTGWIETPGRIGHTFTGWSDGQRIVTGSTVCGYTSTATLTAQWQADSYTVSFVGSPTNPESLLVTYGSPYGTLPVLERAGYTFDGWTLDANPVTAETIVAVPGNHSLTAKWTANESPTTDPPTDGSTPPTDPPTDGSTPPTDPPTDGSTPPTTDPSTGGGSTPPTTSPGTGGGSTPATSSPGDSSSIGTPGPSGALTAQPGPKASDDTGAAAPTPNPQDRLLPANWSKIRPDYTGKVIAGKRVTAVPGPVPAGSKVTYQWFRNGKVIKGATGKHFRLRTKDARTRLSVRQITQTPVGGIYKGVIYKRSSVSRLVNSVGHKVYMGKAKIMGELKPGKKLTAKVTGWHDQRLLIRWTVNGKTVKRNSLTFRIPKGTPIGSKIAVMVRGFSEGKLRASAASVSKYYKVK